MATPTGLPPHLKWTGAGGVWFNRRPRIGWRYEPPTIKLPRAPAVREAQKASWEEWLIPLGGVLMSVSLAASMAGSILGPVVGGVSVLIAFVTIRRQRQERKRQEVLQAQLEADFQNR